MNKYQTLILLVIWLKPIGAIFPPSPKDESKGLPDNWFTQVIEDMDNHQILEQEFGPGILEQAMDASGITSPPRVPMNILEPPLVQNRLNDPSTHSRITEHSNGAQGPSIFEMNGACAYGPVPGISDVQHHIPYVHDNRGNEYGQIDNYGGYVYDRDFCSSAIHNPPRPMTIDYGYGNHGYGVPNVRLQRPNIINARQLQPLHEPTSNHLPNQGNARPVHTNHNGYRYDHPNYQHWGNVPHHGYTPPNLGYGRIPSYYHHDNPDTYQWITPRPYRNQIYPNARYAPNDHQNIRNDGPPTFNNNNEYGSTTHGNVVQNGGNMERIPSNMQTGQVYRPPYPLPPVSNDATHPLHFDSPTTHVVGIPGDGVDPHIEELSRILEFGCGPTLKEDKEDTPDSIDSTIEQKPRICRLENEVGAVDPDRTPRLTNPTNPIESDNPNLRTLVVKLVDCMNANIEKEKKKKRQVHVVCCNCGVLLKLNIPNMAHGKNTCIIIQTILLQHNFATHCQSRKHGRCRNAECELWDGTSLKIRALTKKK